MFRTILKFGVISGLIVGVFEFATFVLFGGMPPLKYGMVIGFVIFGLGGLSKPPGP